MKIDTTISVWATSNTNDNDNDNYNDDDDDDDIYDIDDG